MFYSVLMILHFFWGSSVVSSRHMILAPWTVPQLTSKKLSGVRHSKICKVSLPRVIRLSKAYCGLYHQLIFPKQVHIPFAKSFLCGMVNYALPISLSAYEPEGPSGRRLSPVSLASRHYLIATPIACRCIAHMYVQL